MRNATVIILIGVMIAAIRVWMGFAVEPVRIPADRLLVECYKDGAHIFIGAVLGALIVQGKAWQRLLFWSLCLVETIVAISSRM